MSTDKTLIDTLGSAVEAAKDIALDAGRKLGNEAAGVGEVVKTHRAAPLKRSRKKPARPMTPRCRWPRKHVSKRKVLPSAQGNRRCVRAR